MDLTYIEFMLLQIIHEKEGASGYEISSLLKTRFGDWSDIRTASVYFALNKLGEKKLVTSHVDTVKQGRGPLPKKVEITEAGKKILRQEALAVLASSRERDSRFDLALMAIPLLAMDEVAAALEKRKTVLAEVAERINRIFQAQGGMNLPVNLQALYRHPLLFINREIDFIDELIHKL